MQFKFEDLGNTIKVYAYLENQGKMLAYQMPEFGVHEMKTVDPNGVVPPLFEMDKSGFEQMVLAYYNEKRFKK